MSAQYNTLVNAMKTIKIIFLVILLFGYCTISAKDDIDLINQIGLEEVTIEDCERFISNGQLNLAIESLLQLKLKLESSSEFSFEDYKIIINSLYYCYENIGDYSSARDILNDALNLYGNKGFDVEYRFLMVSLGCLEFKLKNVGGALIWFHEALCKFEEANDFGHSYITLLMNMSLAYLENQEFLLSKFYMEESIELFEESYGNILELKDEYHFIFPLNYGLWFYRNAEFDKAEEYFRYVISNCPQSGITYDAHILASINLSTILVRHGRWKECLEVLNNINCLSDEKSYIISQNKSLAYKELGELKNAAQCLKEFNRVAKENILSIFSSFAETAREDYWSSISEELILVNNLLAISAEYGELNSSAYNNTLFCKNLLLNASRIFDNYAMSSNDTSILNTYKEYKSLREELTYKASNYYLHQRDSLHYLVKNKELEILKSIEDYNELFDDQTVEWNDVRRMLKSDEAALEFCYVPQMKSYSDVESYYGVFILRKDFESPKLILLENSNEINELIGKESLDILTINEFYQTGQDSILYNKIWGKISPYLEGVKSVYYSPVGLLSNLNFEVLRDNEGMMINEKYDLCRVSTTANIAKVKQTSIEPLKTSILYGNIKYDETVDNMISASSAYSKYSGTSINEHLTLRSEDERGGWGPLPSTKEEISNIKSRLEKNEVSVSVFDGSFANEESFKALSGNAPDIIHLATHGFVYEYQDKKKGKGNNYISLLNEYSKKESYMTWSGLLMAGANNVWQGNFDVSNVEDGVLTADEISRMDLGNTKLVVLSACETARGKVEPIDGVFGLQRAFKRAGAGTIVMSLWKVQDDATSMLMTHFYEYLMSGEERHKALWKAMMDVRDVYKDPYYWAGFVMMD